MLSMSINHSLRIRWVWTLLSVLVLSVTTASQGVLSSMMEDMTVQQEALTMYNIGFVTMSGGSPVSSSSLEMFHSGAPELSDRYPFDEGVVGEVLEMEGVVDVFRIAVIWVPTTLPDDSVEYAGLVGVEISAAESALLPYASMWEGRFLEEGDVSCALINVDFEVDCGLSVGDELELNLGGEGVSLEVVGIYDALLSEEINPEKSVVVDFDEFWEILSVPQGYRRYSGVLVEVADPGMGEVVADELRRRYMEEGATVLYQYTLAKYTVALLANTVNTYRFTGLLLLTVASASIVLIRVIDLVRQREEIGLMTSVGWRDSHILGFLFWKSLIIGVLGFGVSLVLMYFGGGFFRRMIVPQKVSRMVSISFSDLGAGFLLQAFILTIALSVLAFLAGYAYYRRLTPLKMLEET